MTEAAAGSFWIAEGERVDRSMKPGATIIPFTSRSISPAIGLNGPMSRIFPSRIRTLARTRGLPVPSTTLPLTSTRFCANADIEKSRATNTEPKIRIYPSRSQNAPRKRCLELGQGYAFFAYPWKEFAINVLDTLSRLRRALSSTAASAKDVIFSTRVRDENYQIRPIFRCRKNVIRHS